MAFLMPDKAQADDRQAIRANSRLRDWTLKLCKQSLRQRSKIASFNQIGRAHV